jgi:hypothetical protein
MKSSIGNIERTIIIISEIIVIFIFLIISEYIDIFKSFFTLKEKVSIPLLVLSIFLFPIIFRIINNEINIERSISFYKKNKNVCPIIVEEKCCIDAYADKLITSGQGVLEINKNKFLNDYKLTLANVMNDKERSFGEQKGKNKRREIWIFSHNLGTEVLGDVSQSVAAKNVENGIRYVYFHTNNVHEQNTVKKNMEIIYSGVGIEKHSLISFIPLEEDSTDGIDIFAHIIGSIIFVAPEEKDEKTSYFSLRGRGTEKPIYFRLPKCMNDNYYNYFAERKIQYENKQNKNS